MPDYLVSYRVTDGPPQSRRVCNVTTAAEASTYVERAFAGQADVTILAADVIPAAVVVCPVCYSVDVIVSKADPMRFNAHCQSCDEHFDTDVDPMHFVDTANGQAACGADVWTGDPQTTKSHDTVTCRACQTLLEEKVG